MLVKVASGICYSPTPAQRRSAGYHVRRQPLSPVCVNTVPSPPTITFAPPTSIEPQLFPAGETSSTLDAPARDVNAYARRPRTMAMFVPVRDASQSGAACGNPPLSNTALQTSSCITAAPPPIRDRTAKFSVPVVPGMANQSVRTFPDPSIQRPTRFLGPGNGGSSTTRMFPFTSPAAACDTPALPRLRLQMTCAAASTRYTCRTPSLDPHVMSTTAPPLEENHVVGAWHASLPTLELDVTEPPGPHVQTCHMSIGE